MHKISSDDIKDLSMVQLQQLENMRKIQMNNDHQKVSNKQGSRHHEENEEPHNFNVSENIEMYIKAQGSDEDLNHRKKYHLDEDLSNNNFVQ